MPSETTKVVFLGTGTPNPEPERQGPAIAILVNDQPYLVDCGVGVVRQAAKTGLNSLAVEKLDRVFITHLHSDHTLGLPDLIFTPAVTGRTGPLHIYGPPGTAEMVSHINQAWSLDRAVRLNGGEPSLPSAYKTEVYEIGPGEIYHDESLRVIAFPVTHGAWKYAFGFRFETADRVIVVSGDTTPCPALVDHAMGCDVLIHEAYSAAGLKDRAPEWQAYHSSYHTSGIELGRLAAQVNPKLLLLNHVLCMGRSESSLLAEVQLNFSGPVEIPADLYSY